MTQNSKQQEIDQKQDGQNIVFFDGYCHLCNGFVDFLIQRDRSKKLFFAPLQGSTAKKFLTPLDVKNLSTVIFKTSSKTSKQSDAIIYIIATLGGIYTLVYILKVIPKVLRDLIYQFIANHRLLWFGERSFCRFPTPEESSQLLP